MDVEANILTVLDGRNTCGLQHWERWNIPTTNDSVHEIQCVTGQSTAKDDHT
jgi:hypothetical protein